jgi:hypothetical protein
VNGRRRNPRYHVSTPFDGVLQTLTGATIESSDACGLVASCDAPLRTGLSLALDVFADSTRRTLPVTVAESVPVIQSGLVRYRLRLAMAGAADDVHREGLLVLDTPVRVLDISENGFLLEAAQKSAAGTVGLLQVTVDERRYEGEIRVIRSSPIESAADRHRLGTEFLRIRRVPYGSALRTAFFAMMRTG